MKSGWWLLLAAVCVFASCRHDEMVFPSQSEETDGKGGTGGMYLLNEGNMGSNKCTLDYYDFSTGVYSRNIYAERNPEQVMELGDVGNDIAVYGSKLYITVNCSHKVEVLDARTAKKIKQIDIPNCRFLTFSDGNAYVSSYIGPVGADPNCPLGAVFRIDTTSLAVTGEVAVGYQPEEMAVADGMLFVANSGGYRPPEYDNRISAISLDSFTLDYSIEAAPNLMRLKADKYGNLWASSRGNYKDEKGCLLKLSKNGDGKYAVSRRFETPCSNFAFRGDSLLYFSSADGKNSYGVLDITTGANLGSFLPPQLESAITRPYGLAVEPRSGNIIITDAKNYVSSGRVYSVSGNREILWEAQTGDIPTGIAFTDDAVSTPGGSSPTESDLGAFISKVYEYCPAPGQFVNLLPIYSQGDTYADMLRKCEESICGNRQECISLGGFGGYVTFGFDHMVENVEGEYDFRLWGNALWQSKEIMGGSAEPGIVMVSYDSNGNGVPDDEWYELAGSEYRSPSTLHNYSVTYHNDGSLWWEDSLGARESLVLNSFHSQNYWPEWIKEASLTFTGTRLAPNAVDADGNGNNYILYSYPWGYADNYPNSFAEANSFDISWAVDSRGNSVSLPGIHFIRVMTGMHQYCGKLGESSTEICKAQDLHYFFLPEK